MGARPIDHRRILERLEPVGTRRSAVELAALVGASPPSVRHALGTLARAGMVVALRTGGRITFERRAVAMPRPMHVTLRPNDATSETASEAGVRHSDEPAKDPRAHRRRVF